MLIHSLTVFVENGHSPPPGTCTAPLALGLLRLAIMRTKGSDREQGPGVDGDVFQVRPLRGAQALVPHLTPRTEGPVIRIDLPRKKYPAWDAHFIDRRLRKTILVLESAAPVTPRIQYRCLGTPKEVMEYETTV
ncbi:XK-related protein 7-like protein [Lates japonicus]|uniref:XK-related protein 7-like protein n=1 Tax=Lates japonicus TaxID=270547 RepID=A0AAD3MB08_LATJO|nr:XK-related protein 7-like protein [Lates japonicus]